MKRLLTFSMLLCFVPFWLVACGGEQPGGGEIPSREPVPVPQSDAIKISPVDGMALSYIPAGTFPMGENPDRGLAECQVLYEQLTRQVCQRDWFAFEEPVHPVTLEAFWMDQTEVTNSMYARCVAAGVCTAPAHTNLLSHQNYYGDALFANYPVIWVDWSSAEAYCEWAGRQLPTEAQWEYAARGGLVGGLYPWGETFAGGLANFCDASCPLGIPNPGFDDGYADVAPVGSFPANGYGLYDLAGNVREWVADWYGPYTSDPAENPLGPPSGDMRVLRGGAFSDTGVSLRVAERGRSVPGEGNDTLGFRCVLSP